MYNIVSINCLLLQTDRNGSCPENQGITTTKAVDFWNCCQNLWTRTNTCIYWDQVSMTVSRMIPYQHGEGRRSIVSVTCPRRIEIYISHSSIFAIILRTKKYASKRAHKQKIFFLVGTRMNNRDLVAKSKLLFVMACHYTRGMKSTGLKSHVEPHNPKSQDSTFSNSISHNMYVPQLNCINKLISLPTIIIEGKRFLPRQVWKIALPAEREE